MANTEKSIAHSDKNRKSRVPKDIQKKLMHRYNSKMYEDGIITEQLYRKVRAEIDRL